MVCFPLDKELICDCSPKVLDSVIHDKCGDVLGSDEENSVIGTVIGVSLDRVSFDKDTELTTPKMELNSMSSLLG